MLSTSNHHASGTLAAAAAMNSSPATTTGSLRTRSSHTPAGRDSSTNGTTSMKVNTPICVGVACNNTAAVNGSASIVTWPPNELIRIDSHRRRYMASRSRSSDGSEKCRVHAPGAKNASLIGCRDLSVPVGRIREPYPAPEAAGYRKRGAKPGRRSAQLRHVQWRRSPRPGHRHFERRGELQQQVLVGRPGGELNTDRQPARVHDKRQRNRRRAHDVVRERELANRAEQFFRQLFETHIGPAEVVIAPRFGHTRGGR